jgi:hypothetical protein
MLKKAIYNRRQNREYNRDDPIIDRNNQGGL